MHVLRYVTDVKFFSSQRLKWILRCLGPSLVLSVIAASVGVCRCDVGKILFLAACGGYFVALVLLAWRMAIPPKIAADDTSGRSPAHTDSSNSNGPNNVPSRPRRT